MSDFFTFWVGPWLCGVEGHQVRMVMAPRRMEVTIPGAAPAVRGIVNFPGPKDPVTIVDLRILFGASTEETDGAALVLVGPDGHSYGLIFDKVDTEFNFVRPVESEDDVLCLPPELQPHVATVVSGFVGGVRKELYRLNLARILSPETLMVN